MNKVSPKVLIHSKWSKLQPIRKEQHFIVTKVTFDEDRKVSECIIEAVMSKNAHAINWRDLKDSHHWCTRWV